MTEVHVLAIDLAKRSFRSAERIAAGRFCLIEWFRVRSSSKCRANKLLASSRGGPRHEPLPESNSASFQPRGPTDSADLREAIRQAPEERRRGCGGDRRGCFAAEHALRGRLAEFGVVVAKGPANLKTVTSMMDDATIDFPETARDIARLYLDQIELITRKIDDLTLRLRNATRENDEMRRLCTAPGVGPMTAGLVLAFARDPRAFSSGGNFAAWLGLVPRQHSTGGKMGLGSVSKMGQTDIRKLLIVGAMSRIRWSVRKGVLPDN